MEKLKTKNKPAITLTQSGLNTTCDAQTSGGLLGFIDPSKADGCIADLRDAGCDGASNIGEVTRVMRIC